MRTSPRLPARPILLISILLLSTGCLGVQGVRVSQDPAVDFSLYRTWSWIPRPANPSYEPSTEEIELSTRVLKQIRVELARRGLQFRAKDSDLGIDAQLVITRERRVSNERIATQTLHSFHYGGNYEIQTTQRRITIHQRGRLTIRAVDRRREQEVWRADYERTTQDGFGPAVAAVVKATLANFPAVSEEADEEKVRTLRTYAELRGHAERDPKSLRVDAGTLPGMARSRTAPGPP